jgi:uncharacterized protein (DUF2062 family)
MPRRLLKRVLPPHQQLREHKYLKVFGALLHDPNLWHLNRHSVSGGFAVGLFCAFLPMPLEMVVAAFGAILFRVNLPLSVGLVWISNPFTWIPLYGPGYLLGAWLLGSPIVPLDHMSIGWLLSQFGPLWLGCTIIGTVLSVLGYFSVHGFWRFKVASDWQKRRERRRRRS